MSGDVDDKRALEALRNGVPNHSAIRALGCYQPQIEKLFRQKLRSLIEHYETGRVEPGFVIAGGFGDGKSHLLGYLEHIALEENFVCSRVAISKETPLYDGEKLFRSAIEWATLPAARGIAIEEVSAKLGSLRASPDYASFYQWATADATPLWPGFGATLKVWESPPDEAHRAILDFWSGQPLHIGDLRRWLKALRLTAAFSFQTIKRADLAPQLPRFAARLFQAAGYRGWVVLLDEAELIGRYTKLQRSRSYAELARWMGLSPTSGMPGLLTVAAMTDDFSVMVLDEKLDREQASERLRIKGDDAGAARAELAMQEIRRAIPLEKPDEAMLRATYETLRELHRRAYGWSPPELAWKPGWGGKRMRAYIREWITRWDLQRFYPEVTPEVEETAVTFSYREDPEVQPPDDSGDSN